MSAHNQQTGSAEPPVRTREKSACAVCGGTGEIAYSGLRDYLFGVAGEWALRRCSDPDCALLWLDPMPIDEDLPELYKTYYTHGQAEASSSAAGLLETIKQCYWIAHYGDTQRAGLRAKVVAGLVSLIAGMRARLDQAMFELPVNRGGRLLEIGFGDASGMRRMAELGWEVEGVDFDEAAVALACSGGLNVRLGSLEAQHYPSDAFDAVVMSHVLEHVPRPRDLLAECRRILKPDGRLVSITPNASSWGHKLFGRDWFGLDPPRHLHIFTPASLRNLALSAGWRQPAVKSSAANAIGTIWASYKLRRDTKFDMRSRPGIPMTLVCQLVQIAAVVRHRFLPETGEELVLHAVKNESDCSNHASESS